MTAHTIENDRATCLYCDARAIGVERSWYSTRLADDVLVNVCRDCARINSTIYLFAGGSWFKMPLVSPLRLRQS